MGQVLVTGARRGIGKAIALALARANFDVAVADIENGDELQAVARQIGEMGMKRQANSHKMRMATPRSAGARRSRRFLMWALPPCA